MTKIRSDKVHKKDELVHASYSRNKRGQAAVEFLVTYGWAILGVLIVVGTLAYYGLFNFQKYTSDACYFGDQMICEDYVAYSNGTIGLKLRNNFGVNIDINSTIIKSEYGTVNCPVSALGLSDIPSGSIFYLNCNLVSGRIIPANTKLKYNTIISFNRHESSNIHNQTGDVIVTVQKV